MLSFSIALTLLATPAHFPQAPQAATAPISIKRTFAASDKAKYDVKVKLETPGGPAEISGLVTVKVEKLLDAKKASVIMSVENFKGTGPSDGDPSEFKVDCDEHGVGDSIGDGNEHIVMSALAVLSAVPTADLKVGDNYSFELKMNNGGLKVKGTFKDLKEIETRKVGFLEWSGTLTTDGGDFELKVKSQIDIANGRLINASADIDNGQVSGKIAIDEKKA